MLIHNIFNTSTLLSLKEKLQSFRNVSCLRREKNHKLFSSALVLYHVILKSLIFHTVNLEMASTDNLSQRQVFCMHCILLSDKDILKAVDRTQNLKLCHLIELISLLKIYATMKYEITWEHHFYSFMNEYMHDWPKKKIIFHTEVGNIMP